MTCEIINNNSKNIGYRAKKHANLALKKNRKCLTILPRKAYVERFLKSTYIFCNAKYDLGYNEFNAF